MADKDNLKWRIPQMIQERRNRVQKFLFAAKKEIIKRLNYVIMTWRLH